MLIGEGVGVGGHFLFLRFEDIGGTEGSIGKRRADGRTRVGTGTQRRLLTGRRWCLDDLCLDDTQNLPDLTTNRGNDHGNLVEEITTITCASQARVPMIRFSEITSWGAGTQVRLGGGEVLEVEVRATLRTVWR
jgi:hypothetical protein